VVQANEDTSERDLKRSQSSGVFTLHLHCGRALLLCWWMHYQQRRRLTACLQSQPFKFIESLPASSAAVLCRAVTLITRVTLGFVMFLTAVAKQHIGNHQIPVLQQVARHFLPRPAFSPDERSPTPAPAMKTVGEPTVKNTTWLDRIRSRQIVNSLLNQGVNKSVTKLSVHRKGPETPRLSIRTACLLEITLHLWVPTRESMSFGCRQVPKGRAILFGIADVAIKTHPPRLMQYSNNGGAKVLQFTLRVACLWSTNQPMNDSRYMQTRT